MLGTPGPDGKRTGSLSLTVTNKGPVDVAQLGFINLELVGERAGGDFDQCRSLPEVGPYWASCVVAGLRAGERRDFTFTFVVDGSAPAVVQGVRVDHYDGQNRGWPDLTPAGNATEVRAVS